MTKKRSTARRRPERHVIVRGVRRESIDVHKLSRALIALMQAKAEAEAKAEHEAREQTPTKENQP